METKVIKIGNSKGILLSKDILNHYNIDEKVNLVLADEHIIVEPIKKVRAGWAEKFKEAMESGSNELLIPDVFEDETFEHL